MPVARLCGGLYEMKSLGCGETSSVSTLFASDMQARHVSKSLFRNTRALIWISARPLRCFEGEEVLSKVTSVRRHTRDHR